MIALIGFGAESDEISGLLAFHVRFPARRLGFLVRACGERPLLAESGHRAQADRREGWQCRLPTHIGYWFGSRAYRSIR